MLGAVFAACGDQAPQPRHVDTSRIADDALVAAVLDECHKPLRGRMDRVAAEVLLPGSQVVRLWAQLPGSLRAIDGEARFLAKDGQVYRLDGAGGDPDGRAGQIATAATPAETVRVEALLALLDAASLGPLHRATGCRRLGNHEWEIVQPAGPPFRLRLHAETLLPASLHGPGGEVILDEHLRSPVTWMVKTATSPVLGRCAIVFEQPDITWTSDFFALPEAKAASGRPRIPFVAEGGVEPRSSTPFRAERAAVDQVLLDDPGTWPERVAAAAPVYEELARQKQKIAGFPILFAEGSRRILAVPFRPRDPTVRLVQPPGWRIANLEAGSLLVVYPADGDLAARCTAGEKLLRDALASQGLVADGPVCVQPFVHLDEGVPPAAKLANPTVRVFVPVR